MVLGLTIWQLPPPSGAGPEEPDPKGAAEVLRPPGKISRVGGIVEVFEQGLEGWAEFRGGAERRTGNSSLSLWGPNRQVGEQDRWMAVATECDQDSGGESTVGEGGGPSTASCPAWGGEGGFLVAVMFEMNYES